MQLKIKVNVAFPLWIFLSTENASFWVKYNFRTKEFNFDWCDDFPVFSATTTWDFFEKVESDLWVFQWKHVLQQNCASDSVESSKKVSFGHQHIITTIPRQLNENDLFRQMSSPHDINMRYLHDRKLKILMQVLQPL